MSLITQEICRLFHFEAYSNKLELIDKNSDTPTYICYL